MFSSSGRGRAPRKRWVDNSQPQTLYIAQILLYIQGIFAVLATISILPTLDWYSAVIAVASLAAARGIANSRRWAWKLGVIAAAIPLLAVLLLTLTETTRWLWANPVRLMFDIALMALLVVRSSREYQRHFFT